MVGLQTKRRIVGRGPSQYPQSLPVSSTHLGLPKATLHVWASSLMLTVSAALH